VVMRSYESKVPLDRRAEQLLDSLTGSIVQDAYQAAASRRDPMNEVSPNKVSAMDIVIGLESRHYRSLRRNRAAFAGQVFGTAVAVSAVVISFAVTVLLVGDGPNSAAPPDPLSTTPLFITVLLALLAVVGATLLVFFVSDVLGKLRAKLFYSSRYRDEVTLVQEWALFEDVMRHDLGIPDDRKSEFHLSSTIPRFARSYGADIEQVRKILRTRNSVVHGTSKVSIRDVRASLEELRALIKVLEISAAGDGAALRRSSF